MGKNCKLLSVVQISLCFVVLNVGKNSAVVFITVPISATPGIVLNVRRRCYKVSSSVGNTIAKAYEV